MIEYRVVEKQLEKYEYNRSTTLWTFRYARNVLFLRVRATFAGTTNLVQQIVQIA